MNQAEGQEITRQVQRAVMRETECQPPHLQLPIQDMKGKLDHKEGWALKNWCFQTAVLEKTLESSLDCKEIKPVSQSQRKSTLKIHWKDTAEAKSPILWPPDANSQLIGKRPWCWERLRARGEGGNRGWDGWMASPTQWTWVWADSGKWWWTGKPGMLQSLGSQKIRHDSTWTTKNAIFTLIRILV